MIRMGDLNSLTGTGKSVKNCPRQGGFSGAGSPPQLAQSADWDGKGDCVLVQVFGLGDCRLGHVEEDHSSTKEAGRLSIHFWKVGDSKSLHRHALICGWKHVMMRIPQGVADGCD